MRGCYYNENDSHAASWLRNLIGEGLLDAGRVDSRDIRHVGANDVLGLRECHFFAGIGGWAYALQLAGWPRDRPIWTASPPCQPYSVAGQGKGDQDARNLWPEVFRLIRECRPECIFGEQVENAIAHEWLDGISSDLESEGYAVGAVVLGAHSVGAPQIRQRLYWVAEPCGAEWNGRGESHGRPEQSFHVANCCGPGGVADARLSEPSTGERDENLDRGAEGERPQNSRRNEPSSRRRALGLGDAQGHGRKGKKHGSVPRAQTRERTRLLGSGGPMPYGPWDDFDVLYCTDGKSRRIEPGSFPLADGLPGRVGRLRGYGNAVVPQLAADFVRAFMHLRGVPTDVA